MTVRQIKFTYLRSSVLSRVILLGFGTVNSPVCISALWELHQCHSVFEMLRFRLVFCPQSFKIYLENALSKLSKQVPFHSVC